MQERRRRKQSQRNQRSLFLREPPNHLLKVTGWGGPEPLRRKQPFSFPSVAGSGRVLYSLSPKVPDHGAARVEVECWCGTEVQGLPRFCLICLSILNTGPHLPRPKSVHKSVHP